VITELDGQLDGGVMEGLLGETWSVETWGSFNQMMQSYRRQIDAMHAPKLGIFGHNNLGDTDYKTMRYGLCACLMDDGYYYASGTSGYDAGHMLWFDEYDARLGQALEPRRESAWSMGVWKREFEHGIVLVNPRGNGARTVDLGGTFHKLTGTQDAATNDGSTVTSVHLADRDGIILLR